MKRPDNRAAGRPEKTAVPFVIPVFTPHAGCPHRCVFCNQTTITSTRPRLPSTREIRKQVRRFLGYRSPMRGKSQIAFFGGNFLGLPHEDVTRLLEQARHFVTAGEVDAIRFSTRPDTVDEARLDQIAPFPISTIELGVQSMDDRVLRLAQRGHTAADTESALALLRRRDYETGCQMMVGLPGDDDAGALASARRIAAMEPDFVRIYPTLVLEGSRLAAWYREGRYAPLALGPCIGLVTDLYRHFVSRGIRVVRMGLQASPELEDDAAVLAGPYHPAFGHLVFSKIFLDRAMAGIKKLGGAAAGRPRQLDLRVNPGDESRMRGLHNSNLASLGKTFPDTCIRILADPGLERGDLIITETSPEELA